MHFLKYLPILFVPAVLASPAFDIEERSFDIEERTFPVKAANAATVVQDIAVVSQRVAALNNSVVAYKGIQNAFDVQQKASQVSDALKKTTADAKASKKWNDDESAAVGIPLLNLQPDVINLLDNLQAKRKTFGGLAPVVKKILQDQRGQTVDLGNAITAKLSPDFAAVAPGVIKEITDKFDQTIAVYSK